jgi:hypothetical protein
VYLAPKFSILNQNNKESSFLRNCDMKKKKKKKKKKEEEEERKLFK